MEVTLEANDPYEVVAEQAAITLSMEEEDGELMIFRADGTMVPNVDVEVGSVKKQWTLDRYLHSQGKSSQQLKLGVGYRYEVCLKLCCFTLITSQFRKKQTLVR